MDWKGAMIKRSQQKDKDAFDYAVKNKLFVHMPKDMINKTKVNLFGVEKPKVKKKVIKYVLRRA